MVAGCSGGVPGAEMGLRRGGSFGRDCWCGALWSWQVLGAGWPACEHILKLAPTLIELLLLLLLHLSLPSA